MERTAADLPDDVVRARLNSFSKLLRDAGLLGQKGEGVPPGDANDGPNPSEADESAND